MGYSEVVKVYEIGPIAVSDDREQDLTYKVEVLRDVGDGEAYRLFLWSKDRYFVNRRPKPLHAGVENQKWDNPYSVEVRRDVEGTEEYHLFNWDKDKFVQQLRENPNHWEEKLIEAKDNSVFWEEMSGPTVESVLTRLTEALIADFSSLGGDMKSVRCRELVKTVDLEPISIENTNEYYRFRIEIMRDQSPKQGYQGSVYRYTSYSLQPTFAPDGELAYDVAGCWLWIEDEQSLLGHIEGGTAEEVVEQAVKARDELEVRLRTGG